MTKAADTHAPRGPLHGVRVLDLTRVLAGPFCTLLLWELGAEVIKVEAPGHGDDTRLFPPYQNGESVYFAGVNRGKRSIALDLKSPADRVIFERLLAQADVLVENFRPGTLAKLGYAPTDLEARFPQLVIASISGFGQTGPLAPLPAYDLVAQALSGMMSINGPEGGEPTRLGVSMGDLGAGMFAAIGIIAALYGKQQFQRGARVDVAMLDSLVMLLEQALVRGLATGEKQRATGSRHSVITPFDAFRCADRWIVIGCANEKLFAALARTLGRPDWTTDPRFDSMLARAAHHVALKAEMEAALGQAPAAQWLAALEAAGVPAAPIHYIEDVINDPQIAARNMIVGIDDPEMGSLRVSGSPIKISGYADPPTRPPAPNYDEARAELLASLGLDADGRATETAGASRPEVW